MDNNDDGRRAMTIAHLSLQLRWAKKVIGVCILPSKFEIEYINTKTVSVIVNVIGVTLLLDAYKLVKFN